MPVSFSHNPQKCPTLHLHPLNNSFLPKHIPLPPQQRVKIGRRKNAETVPAERNGYFESKVLSRQHAEVWEESGKIFIKDLKSSSGTFVNEIRLSAEGFESEPFELRTGDIVEFGIDIIGHDNRTVIHQKVSARVVCFGQRSRFLAMGVLFGRFCTYARSHLQPQRLSLFVARLPPVSSNAIALQHTGKTTGT